jgi:sulfite reductase (NADPH) flavoprotein alpha-component
MFPDHAPLSPAQRQALASVLGSLDGGQRAWLSGFLAGSAPLAVPLAAALSAPVPLTILYGTESGNSEALADKSAKEAKRRGFKPVVRNMAQTPAASLAAVENLLVIVSTWGDGEPPEAALEFYREFMNGAPSLAATRFAVCALGDTSYEKFCQTGKDIDARLEALGATRVAARQDCDVDYEEAHAAWLEQALAALAPAVAPGAAAAVVAPAPLSEVLFDKRNPFPAEVLANLVLNGDRSEKETRHLELSLEGSGMSYLPGDALAVVPLNPDDAVEAVLKASGLTGSEEIEVKGAGRKPLAAALREDFDITALSRAVLRKYQDLAGSAKLAEMLADDAKDSLKNFLWGRQIVDALEEFPVPGLTAHQLAGIFRKLPPRLYSIASSPLAHPDEVHLTVAAVRYHSHGRDRKGIASTFLADLAPVGSKVAVYTHQNKNFRLPEAPETPIIMVGPGTGVAPFRAFVEHRAALAHPGKSWLFFGEQRYNEDFLYQLEWQEHLKSGALSRLEVAFSRDQPEKVYVQHRMVAHGAELFAWLEEGASFYVCGDAERMAVDVHEALVKIVAEHGGRSPAEAEAYLDALRKQKRYQRDVY